MSDDEFIPLPTVLKLTGIRTTLLYDLQRKGLFPRSFRIVGSRAVRWSLNDVRNWQQQQHQRQQSTSEVA